MDATTTMIIHRAHALKRARARQASAGAAMFIVVITLGVLAVMGVYGLSATALDIRAAGHLRENAQGAAAVEHMLKLTAETFTPGTSGELVRAMQAGRDTAGADIQATNCKTAKPFSTLDYDHTLYRAAEACLNMSTKELETLNAKINAWQNVDATYGTFSPKDANGVSASLGRIADLPFIRVEVTNPVDIPPPPGSGLTDRYTFTQLTTTVYLELKPTKTSPATLITQGRGRMTVGPYYR